MSQSQKGQVETEQKLINKTLRVKERPFLLYSKQGSYFLSLLDLQTKDLEHPSPHLFATPNF